MTFPIAVIIAYAFLMQAIQTITLLNISARLREWEANR